MYFFSTNFIKLKRQVEEMQEVVEQLPNDYFMDPEKFREGSVLVAIQKQINTLYRSLFGGKFPYFFEFFQSKILKRPFLKEMLDYVQEYVEICKEFVELQCENYEFYDKEENIKLPSS